MLNQKMIWKFWKWQGSYDLLLFRPNPTAWFFWTMILLSLVGSQKRHRYERSENQVGVLCCVDKAGWVMSLKLLFLRFTVWLRNLYWNHGMHIKQGWYFLLFAFLFVFVWHDAEQWAAVRGLVSFGLFVFVFALVFVFVFVFYLNCRAVGRCVRAGTVVS